MSAAFNLPAHPIGMTHKLVSFIKSGARCQQFSYARSGYRLARFMFEVVPNYMHAVIGTPGFQKRKVAGGFETESEIFSYMQ